AGPVGSRNDDLVTWIAAGQNGVVAGMLRPAVHRDLLGAVFDLVFDEELLGDGLFQLGNARGRRVLGAAGLEGLDGGILDVLGRVEIRLTGAEACDVLSLSLHFLRRGSDG